MTSSQRRTIPITPAAAAVDRAEPRDGRPDDDLAGLEAVAGPVRRDDGAAAPDARAAPDATPDVTPDAAPDATPDADADAAPELEQIAADDGADLARVSAQRDEYLALAQRTRADFDNYRKRITREARMAEDRGVIKVVRDLLPALDNLQRALDSADSDDPLLAGVRLVLSDIQAAFSRLGVEAFSPLGEEFDPQEHEAMAIQPVPGALAGSVVEVYQPGYRVKETMIRPARVVVAG